MRTIRGRGCDIRFDCFVCFDYFVCSLENAARTQGWNGIRSGQGVYIGAFGGAGSASSMSARQEGGFYLPGPLNTRVGVDAQGKTGGEPVGVLGLQAGYEGKRRPSDHRNGP